MKQPTLTDRIGKSAVAVLFLTIFLGALFEFWSFSIWVQRFCTLCFVVASFFAAKNFWENKEAPAENKVGFTEE